MVSFSPRGGGRRNAAILISDNAPGAPHIVALTGTGTGVYSISPRTAVLTPAQTRQFVVAGSENDLVTWLVDGLVGGSPTSGTITPTGLYSPPPIAGTHIVTVASSDKAKSASAPV